MPQTPQTAIYFHTDAIEGDGRDLIGRRSAGQSFLAAYLAHSGSGPVRAIVDTRAQGTALRDEAERLGCTRELAISGLTTAEDFASAKTVFYPSPGFQRAPWLRQRHDPSSCSLVGITHTMSTRRVVEGLHRLMAEPVEEWDAIICTSRAVHSVVKGQLDVEEAYFKQRFGATRMPRPQLPVIPLGINSSDFAPSADRRAAIRTAQSVPKDSIVVLSVGRLSVIEKANPVPLLLALEQVAERTGQDIHLWLAGWASREGEEALHKAAAEALCTRVTVRILDGRDAQVRRDIWSGADIFTLPADSIQETFGLVPVEAMAAGLPVVMPDWDGFRDTVIHGQTGFLIPTRMATPGMGEAIASRFADGRDSYLQHLTLTQSHIQLDVPAYAQALERLVLDADLRARMGAAGQAHVKANLDWQAIIPRYLELAGDLAERRGGTVTTPTLSGFAPNPMQIDPFALYQRYPSELIRAEELVTLTGPVDAGQLDLLAGLNGWTLYKRHTVPTEALHSLCTWLSQNGPASVQQIAKGLGIPLTRAAAMVLVLAKTDVVRLPPPALRTARKKGT